MTASFVNSTTTVSAAELSLTDIVDGSVISASYSARVMAGLVTQKSLAGQPTDTARFPRWPSLTAASVAETTDLTNTQIDTTEVSITVGEVGIMIAVTDNLQEDDIIAGLVEYGEQGGKALADKQDADLAALLSGFSNTTGVTTGGLTVSAFLDAIAALDARDATKPYVAVLHPTQWAQLSKNIATASATIWAQGAGQGDSRLGQQGAFVGNFFGVDVYQSTNVPTNIRATVAVYDGAVFSREALAWVEKRQSRTEFERDASARLTEIVVTSRYGVGELVDAWGQVLYSNQA